MNTFDIISIGDSTVDVFLTLDPHDVETVCSLDREKCLISFDYGAKVPVSQMTRIPGVGNAANFAVGTARLGFQTSIYTVLGTDTDSQDSKKVLEREDVDTSLVIQENGARSNFSAVLNYSGERTIFVYHEDRKYSLPSLPQTKWLYYTSIGKGHELLHTQVPEYVKNSGAKLAFNPGSYQLREGLEVLKPILELCEVLILNREEAQFLTQGDLSDIKGLFAALKKTGPKIVVITDGVNGSYASYDGVEIVHMGIPDTPVVERTGCGDAYSTGFIAALNSGLELSDAISWGTMNATSVIQHIGAQEGLLTKSKMQEMLAQYKESLKLKII